MLRRPRHAGVSPHPVRAHHLHQHALAQPAVGDAHPPAREFTPDRIQDGAAGEHKIGALGADAGIGDALLVAHGDQPIDHGSRLRVRHPAAVDAAAVVALEIEMHARDGGHGAGGAEQVHAVDRRRAVGCDERREVGRHFLHHGLIDVARDIVAAVALGQRHDPHRHRGPGLDLRQRRPTAARRRTGEPHQFGGAAADVEQDHALGVGIHQRRAAGGGQLGLGLAIDDLEFETDFIGDSGAELPAVRRPRGRPQWRSGARG